MSSNSRIVNRENIELEEIVGSFHLDAGDKHFEQTFVNDVSVSGAGIQLSSPLEVGSNIDLTFVAGDWNVSVEAQVVWCTMHEDQAQARAIADAEANAADSSYRVGVKFNPRNTNNNVIFFMASRSMVRPAM